jgi:hypothetical protein
LTLRPGHIEDVRVRTLVWALGCSSLLACGPTTPALTSDQLEGKRSMVVLLEDASGVTAEARALIPGGPGVRLDTTTVDRVTVLLYDEVLEALPGLRAGALSLASEGGPLPPQDAAFELVVDADDRRWRQLDALSPALDAVRLAKAPAVCDTPKIEYVKLVASTATTTIVVFVERAGDRDVLVGTNDHQLWRVRVGTTLGDVSFTELELPRDRPGAGAGWLDHDGRHLWVSNGTDLVTYDLEAARPEDVVQPGIVGLPGFVNHLSGPPTADDRILLATTSNAEVLRIDMDEGRVHSLGTATTSTVPKYYQDMRVLRTSSVTVLTQESSEYWEVTETGLEHREFPTSLGCTGATTALGRGTVWRNTVVVAVADCKRAANVGLAELVTRRNWDWVLEAGPTIERARSLAVLGDTLFVGHADSDYSRYSDLEWCKNQPYGDAAGPPEKARLQLNFAVAIDDKTVVVAGPRVNGDAVGPLAIGVLRFPL